jgi:hypothetical protein
MLKDEIVKKKYQFEKLVKKLVKVKKITIKKNKDQIC